MLQSCSTPNFHQYQRKVTQTTYIGPSTVVQISCLKSSETCPRLTRPHPLLLLLLRPHNTGTSILSHHHHPHPYTCPPSPVQTILCMCSSTNSCLRPLHELLLLLLNKNLFSPVPHHRHPLHKHHHILGCLSDPTVFHLPELYPQRGMRKLL